jgi:hypothetical protein
MTVSEKRSAAARANGALSHGPKTPEGKARSSQNATKHGLLSQIVVLGNENLEGFEDITAAYCRRFQPADDVELGMVEEMVAAYWRLRRALAIEMGMMEAGMASRPAASSALDRITGAFSGLSDTPKLNTIHRYQTRLHQMHSRILRDYVLLRKMIPPVPIAPEPSSDVDAPLTATPPSGDNAVAADAELPNEPKTPLPSTEQPASNPPATPLAPHGTCAPAPCKSLCDNGPSATLGGGCEVRLLVPVRNG